MRRALASMILVSMFSFLAHAEIEVFLPKPAPPAWWGRSGEKWQAVFAVGPAAQNHYQIKSVDSKIYVDSRDGVLKLGAQNSPDPLFFVSGADLKAGPVDLASKIAPGSVQILTDTTPISFEFKGQKWLLTRKTLAKKGVNREYYEAQTAYTLVSGSKVHELGELTCRLMIQLNQKSCEEKITINFAGDLDRDGIPDLFFLPAPERNGPDDGVLWLSSKKTLAKVAPANTELGSKPYQAKQRPKSAPKDEGLSAKQPNLLIPDRKTGAQKLALSGDTYLALNEKDLKWKFSPTEIWVACPVGECEDSSLIETTSVVHPLFLARGIPGLKAGPIDAAEIKLLANDPDKDASFESFEITFHGVVSKLVGGQGVFKLETPSRQTVFPLKTQDPDDKPKLIWAGDINHDGKLDLFFEVAQDEARLHLLFVSPEAATGPIAGPTARFCTGTCY